MIADASDYKIVKSASQKHIALIAHDNCKADLIAWARQNKEVLSRHFLCGTGTTAHILAKEIQLPITPSNSGPLGGDQQIGARIAEGQIDFMIFFWDPLAAQPHDPDVKALTRIAVLYNIPTATNPATADFLLSSPMMNESYERKVIDYSKRLHSRSKAFSDISQPASNA